MRPAGGRDPRPSAAVEIGAERLGVPSRLVAGAPSALEIESIRITHTDTARHAAFLRYIPRVFPRLGFRPWYSMARAVEPGDEALFVRGALALPAEPFKLPMLAQT